MGSFVLGEHVPFILFTGIVAVIDFFRTPLQWIVVTKGLFWMMIPHGKEKIPAGRKLFLPWALTETVVGGLDGGKGRGGRYGKPLLF